MKCCILKKIDLGEIILSVSAGPNFILVGGSSKTLKKILVEDSVGEPLNMCSHTKSIRHVTYHDNIIACGSYDCKATVFKDGICFDIIEGPDTEIKGLAICKGYIAIATRGKTVWVYRIDEEIEIDTILEDHTQDVKGVKWNMGCLYSYGYDGCINMYEDMELIQSIKEHKSTVWDIQFYGEQNMVSCSEDGEIIFYSFENIWKAKTRIRGSDFPIYTMAIYKNKYIGYVHNRSSILFIDEMQNDYLTIKDAGLGDIYSISIWDNLLVVGGEDGILKILQIE
ncbi:putative cytosolic Fe-S cluster assembly factor [Astathelohania contejeani]|uniref:Cytosolic Fe-S cluster assembly factor n=1 Tax=Astathelohania contejeani TaxID=164912 RepID=A0ABQ7I0F7_9MICR|nr:putative cytosolic Fe-S cluster assembly factor [Thelohania contejeani]